MVKRILISMMLISSLSFRAISAAPGPQDERRIEEQKREKLKSTEVLYEDKKKTAQAPPLSQEDIVYLSDMTLRNVTYGYDLCKTLVILKGVENEYIGLDAQVKYLVDQNYLPEDAAKSFDPMTPLRRGLTAATLRNVLDIKGGIFLRIFDKSERYALKELAYEGIMSSGNVNEIISGDELAAAITRAINYRGGK